MGKLKVVAAENEEFRYAVELGSPLLNLDMITAGIHI
jgi:hypothetical protein